MNEKFRSTLNEKQKKYAREFLVDLNYEKAAVRAGYSEQYAKKLLREPEMQRYLKFLMNGKVWMYKG